MSASYLPSPITHLRSPITRASVPFRAGSPQQRRADDPGFVTETRRYERDPRDVDYPRMSAGGLLGREEKATSSRCHSPPDDHDLGGEQGDGARQGDAQPAACPVDDIDGYGIALVRRSSHQFRRDRVEVAA